MLNFEQDTYALFRHLAFNESIRNGRPFQAKNITAFPSLKVHNECKKLMRMGYLQIVKMKPLQYQLTSEGIEQTTKTYQSIKFYQHKMESKNGFTRLSRIH